MRNKGQRVPDVVLKFLSILVFIVFIIQIALNTNGVVDTTGTNIFIQSLLNPVFLLLMVQVLMSSFIVNKFRNKLWIFVSKKEALDEREIALRRMIYETSYKLVSLMILALLTHITISDAIFIYDSNFVLSVVFQLFTIPSIVALWLNVDSKNKDNK